MRAVLRLVLLLAVATLVFGCGPEPRKVVLWHAYRGDEQAALERVVGDYRARNPGVEVELLAVPFDAYAAKLESAIPSGHGPDLFIDTHARLGAFVAAHLVAPAPAFDDAPYDRVSIDAVTAGGVRYGLPLSEKCLALLVRDDVISQTPESLEAIARSPMKQGVFPIAYAAQGSYAHAAVLGGFGGELLHADDSYGFWGPAAEQSLALVASMTRAHEIPEEPTDALVIQLFREGKAASVIEGPWVMGDLAQGVPYRVEPLPKIAATGLPMKPLLTVESAFVTPTGADNLDAKALFVALASREAAVTLATVGKQVVARGDAWGDPALAGDARLRGFHDAVKNATPTPKALAMQAAWEPSDKAIAKVLRGGDPHAALEEARARFLDATKPPPPPASPTPALVVIGLVLLGMSFFAVRRVRAPSFRAELAASKPAYRYVTHAALVVVVLVIAPLFAGAVTSLFAGPKDDMHYVGLANYLAILTARGGPLLGKGSFYLTLLVTVLWTALNLTLHVTLGLVLGVLLSRPMLKLKAAYRVLLVLPWAVPSYVTALAWKGMFHRQFGAINAILSALGCEPVSWFSKFQTALAANVTTNVWLGFPFMMVVVMGALTSIPEDVLEAALVDGATRWQRFRKVTLPLLVPSLLPSVVLGAVWTFNMFNVVFLVSGGEPDGSTDILVSEAYRWAFTRESQYGYAAAYAVLIFLLLFFVSRVERRLGRPA